MMFDSTETAVAVLKDENRDSEERVHAVKHLELAATPEIISLLVTALNDDEYSVRWAASEALAQLGDEAFPALLRALARPDNDQRLREGAKHIIHTSRGSNIQKEGPAIVKAMHGPSQDIATMEAASDVMMKLHIA
jgi:hypothetical protein